MIFLNPTPGAEQATQQPPTAGECVERSEHTRTRHKEEDTQACGWGRSR